MKSRKDAALQGTGSLEPSTEAGDRHKFRCNGAAPSVITAACAAISIYGADCIGDTDSSFGQISRTRAPFVDDVAGTGRLQAGADESRRCLLRGKTKHPTPKSEVGLTFPGPPTMMLR